MSNKTKGLIFVCVFVFSILVPHSYGEEQQSNSLRTIEFETSEVTKAEVALAPDGNWMIFTMLGHLFRMPVEGGNAEQLTFGSSCNTQPAISPDGTRVAFISDRDGSEGNVCVLELSTREIRRITHESWAVRPRWTPDSQKIVYLQMSGRWDLSGPWRLHTRAIVRRIAIGGGEPEALTTQQRDIRCVFFLPDGSLAWSVVNGPPWTTQIEVMNAEGETSTLCELTGEGYLVEPRPSGDGLVCSILRKEATVYATWEELLYVSLPDRKISEIKYLQRMVFGNPWMNTGFAVSKDSKYLYIGDTGRIWKIEIASDSHELIDFHATVKLEIQDPIQPPRWRAPDPGSSTPPRSILDPRISANGSKLIFRAAGSFWLQSFEQPPDGTETSQAELLFDDDADIWDLSFSPDGRYLAYLRQDYHKDQLIEERRLYDLENREMSQLALGDFWRGHSWSADGHKLIYVDSDEEENHTVVAYNLSDGTKEKVADHIDGMRFVRLSPDGYWLYYFLGPDLYRRSLVGNAEPERLTQFSGYVRNRGISPDCKWVAFNRNREIWGAQLNGKLLRNENFQRLRQEGGDFFSFTHDSSSLIYSYGNRVWKHTLESGKREVIPVHLELQRPVPAHLLVKHIRILDFSERGFGQEAALLIEEGRIQWIGSEQGHKLPPGTLTVDGEGRYAIPGLFDMHVHSRIYPLEAFIAYGVTSVRDVGSPLPYISARSDQGEYSSSPLPRFFYAGDSIRGAYNGNPRIFNEEDARNIVRQQKDYGAYTVKIYFDVPWPLQRVAIEEARKQGMAITRHTHTLEGIVKDVRLGYTSFEHNRYIDRYYDDVIQMVSLSGTQWVDTIMVWGGSSLLFRSNPELMFDPKLMAFAPEWKMQTIKSEGASTRWKHPIAVLHGFVRAQFAGIKRAHEVGVGLLAGTDAPTGNMLFGLSLHGELEYLVQAGINPIDVLQIATQKAAEAVGAKDDLGTIEPGKLADIVLLDKNPIEDIRNTQSIWRVIKGGWVFDPDKLKLEAESSKK